MLPQEQDYLELLTGAEEKERQEVESVEDGEMRAELRRQEKQALVDRILKAKQQKLQQQGSGGGGGGAGAFMAPNKGQPSPYLQRKVSEANEGVGDREMCRRSEDSRSWFAHPQR